MNCNNCKANFTTGFLCTACKDFSFCSRCFVKKEHPHVMKNTALVSPSTSRDQTQTCSDHPIRHFVQGLSRIYRSFTGSQQGACQFIFTHIVETNLSCNCIVCKQMSAIFENHSKKCQIPGCSFADCPLIKELFDKRKATAIRNSMTEANAIQKLMEIRVAIETAQAGSTSQIAPTAAPEVTSVTRPGVFNRKFAIQRCIRTLEHAYRCTDANCMPISCQKMKRVLAHIKICKRKISGGCVVCKQVCALCCYHAKNCNERKCTVLLCTYIKRKLRAINAKQLALKK
ncbi:hypothetical protein ILUMI_25995 [Ignelater luminosus]|uniref:histone acetyltransferase n=1 Tax=Ignelater luminosus TaxID=2038154 RepID=A0A8K0C4T7_IGNLU|nr:hypothetical protein ILUMI_25995 [Ignelater luminosus]